VEQYDKLFEYRMLGEVFDFQAPSENLAKRYHDIAIEHFKQRLGDRFSQQMLKGPVAVVNSAHRAKNRETAA